MPFNAALWKNRSKYHAADRIFSNSVSTVPRPWLLGLCITVAKFKPSSSTPPPNPGNLAFVCVPICTMFLVELAVPCLFAGFMLVYTVFWVVVFWLAFVDQSFDDPFEPFIFGSYIFSSLWSPISFYLISWKICSK